MSLPGVEMRNEKHIIYVNLARILSILVLFTLGVLFHSHVLTNTLAKASPDFIRWIKTLGGLFVIHSLFMVFYDLHADSFTGIRPYVQLILNGCYAILLVGLISSIEIVPVLSFSKNGLEIISDDAYTNTPLRILLFILLGSICISMIKSLKTIWGGGGIGIQES